MCPQKLECHLRLIKFNDEKQFKEGLRSSLWDCDMCSYNIEIENIKIEATIIKHLRGQKLIVYKMRPKKKTRKKQGHRQDLTRIFIEKIVII